MPTRSSSCSLRDTALALAEGTTAPEDRDTTVQHLTECEPCRTTFRTATAERFPRLRSYTIIEEIGKGGFGVVYKAVHHSKARIEALKVMFGKTPLREAYFENEVQLSARLQHPNIATLYEAHLTSKPHYFAMEHVEGQQFDAYVREHEVSLEQRIEIIKTVASAIDYAHRAGVIHRDLKPQNILIDADGQPHILDFGIAKRAAVEPAAEGNGRTEGVLGTYGYMSPEQVAGQPVDERTDIYSLGALLFHIITGQPARRATETSRLAAVLRKHDVSRAADLAAIIACCVQHFPEHRYPSCAALVADLENYLAGRATTAQSDPTPAYHVSRLAALVVRNNPLAVQATVSVTLAFALAWMFWHGNACWVESGDPPGQTAIIAFQPSTLSYLAKPESVATIPGLELKNRKSWRLLYGQLLERLSAAKPRVVVWDYFFPDCQPQYDPAFIAGMNGVGAPVVIGAKQLDVNGEPQLCDQIRAAAHTWGHLSAQQPGAAPNAVYLPLAIQRGFNSPTPALALAAAAAARHPDCEMVIRADVEELELRYRRRASGRNERRWRAEVDRVPIVKNERPHRNDLERRTDDRYMVGRFTLRELPQWAQDVIAVEDVLRANPQQLRDWFFGRAVLIGQMIPPADLHQFRAGQWAYGCQIQALMLDDLLRGAWSYRVTRGELAIRTCLTCLLAMLLVNMLPAGKRFRVRTILTITALIVFGAFLAGLFIISETTSRVVIEIVVLTTALVVGGSAAYCVRRAHLRQLQLTPGPVWSLGDTTVSTTLMVTTSGTSSSQEHVAAGGGR